MTDDSQQQMSFFSPGESQDDSGAIKNHLPFDGTVHYWGRIFTADIANQLMNRMLETVPWKHDEAVIYGKHIITRRQYAWYADTPYEYTYSGITRSAIPWTRLMQRLRLKVEGITGQHYNSCLLNLYPDGESGMAWHRDDEKDLLSNGSIASLSFGAKRKFALKHIASKEKVEFWLDNGDLLEMTGTTQQHWMHSVMKSKRISEPRINLTFRQMLR